MNQIIFVFDLLFLSYIGDMQKTNEINNYNNFTFNINFILLRHVGTDLRLKIIFLLILF